ncbi:Menin [Fasciola gigantica]|uniref:Menin n=1 Tax=Fasciola gigantica TaxID=46835 RepID=A0A504YK05_FASGI|nr:Menin [Fasciola gigantica]
MTLRSRQAHGSIRTWRRHFPLTSVDDVVELFRDILLAYGFHPLESSERLRALRRHESSVSDSHYTSTDHGINILTSHKQEPDLAFVSILLGLIEHQLTEPEGHTSFRLKARPSHNLSLSPKHNHRTICSPLSIHVELPEEDVFTGTGGEQTTPDLLPHSPDESETKSQCGSISSVGRVSTRRRRGADRVRRRHILSTSSDQNPPNLNANGAQRRFSDSTAPTSFPCITFEEMEQRYHDFFNLITTSPKLLPFMIPPSTSKLNEIRPSASTTAPAKTQWATRQLICAVCEVLWCRMTVNKSRERLAHSQSIHSLLSAGILDSFGLAYATVAACRLLGYLDVDLALSEDHGWVEFGPPDARQTADVASWIPGAHLLTARENDTPDSTVEQGSECGSHDDTRDKNNPPPIRVPPLVQSWLYVNGHPVICRPSMRAVVAAVAALQPGSSLPAYPQVPTSAPSSEGFGTPPLTPHTPRSSDLISPNGLARHLSSSTAMSMQLVTLKHRLLWLFFDAGCLSRYPLGLTNLGDLEDAFPCIDNLKLFSGTFHSNYPVSIPDGALNRGEPFSMALALYHKAVDVDRFFYANQHVYPYTCLASCLYRHGDNRGALRYWSEAARVMGHYNHSSEDWEIYRELLEVATQLMPQMFRCAAEASRSCSEGAVETDPDGCLYQPGNILDDPQCLAHLLAFYDHLCLWEEGSPVPVLHVGWVDKLMVSLTRFSQRARRLLRLSVNSSRFDENTPQCTATISEPVVFVDNGLPTKRTRRHSRSVPVDRDESQSQTQPSPTNSITVSDRNFKTVSQAVWSVIPKPKPKEIANLVSTTTIPSNATNTGSAKATTSQVTNQANSAKTDSRIPVDAIPHVFGSHTTHPITVDQSKSTKKKKNVKSKSRSKAKELPPYDVQVRVDAPDLKPQNESARSNSPVVADQNGDLHEILLLQEPTSPDTLSTSELLSHDDILASLAEVCDQRLLNPAFLWGLERNVPFLPANVAPEDAFTRLLSVLEPDSGSLFPTPPNSGGLYEPVTEKLAVDHSDPLDSAGKSLSDVEDFTNTEFVLSTECTEGQASEHSSDIPLFPDCLDSVDGTENMVALDEISDEFLQSVSDLVQGEHTTTTPPPDVLSLTSPVTESSGYHHGVHSPQEADRAKPRTMEELTVDLVLNSIKMVSIIELLRAPRFNSSAIKLALTAQSQVCMRRTGLCPASNV